MESKRFKAREGRSLLHLNIPVEFICIPLWYCLMKKSLKLRFSLFMQRNSIGAIWNPANVCSVQFSAHSTNLLALGCADNNIYCYDLRNTRVPWCTLSGHGKTISYVKFLDFETIVSASTDNSLKMWNLKGRRSDGLSNDCIVTFKGHTNEKVS